MRLGHTGASKKKSSQKIVSEVKTPAAEPVYGQSSISQTLNDIERHITRLERENEMLKTRNSALEARLKKISSLVDQ
jgi:cell division septum initiation protein DivIVA